MTSIGTGYALSASTSSPDGRIFQVSSLSNGYFRRLLTSSDTGRIREQGSR